MDVRSIQRLVQKQTHKSFEVGINHYISHWPFSIASNHIMEENMPAIDVRCQPSGIRWWLHSLLLLVEFSEGCHWVFIRTGYYQQSYQYVEDSIQYSICANGLPIRYSVIAALKGLPIGYRVTIIQSNLLYDKAIVILTGLLIGYSVIKTLTYMQQKTFKKCWIKKV